MMELQSEYAKTSYETFVAEAKRTLNLYLTSQADDEAVGRFIARTKRLEGATRGGLERRSLYARGSLTSGI